MTHMIYQGMFFIITPARFRRLCRADEIQYDGRFLGSLGLVRLLPALPLGVGQRRGTEPDVR